MSWFGIAPSKHGETAVYRYKLQSGITEQERVMVWNPITCRVLEIFKI